VQRGFAPARRQSLQHPVRSCRGGGQQRPGRAEEVIDRPSGRRKWSIDPSGRAPGARAGREGRRRWSATDKRARSAAIPPSCSDHGPAISEKVMFSLSRPEAGPYALPRAVRGCGCGRGGSPASARSRTPLGSRAPPQRRVAEMEKLFEDNGPRAGQGKVSDASADAHSCGGFAARQRRR
jgi:hypothetical protein